MKLKTNRKPKARYEPYQVKMDYFQTQAKADRYLQLIKFSEQKLIIDLELYPTLTAVVHNVKVCTFQPDFRYMTLEINGHRGYRVIEDVKADATELYKLRKQLIELTNSCIINNIKASEVNKWVTTIPKNQ